MSPEFDAEEPEPAGGAGESALAERIRERIEDYPDFPRPGIVFRDLAPVLAAPDLLEMITERLAGEALRIGATRVAGIESRGFLFAAPVAVGLGLPLVPIRKRGKLPGATLAATYELEYGEAELEMQLAAITGEDRILVVDDLLATGGTLEAACRLVRKAGGSVAGLAVVVELGGLGGRDRLNIDNLLSLLVL